MVPTRGLLMGAPDWCWKNAGSGLLCEEAGVDRVQSRAQDTTRENRVGLGPPPLTFQRVERSLFGILREGLGQCPIKACHTLVSRHEVVCVRFGMLLGTAEPRRCHPTKANANKRDRHSHYLVQQRAGRNGLSYCPQTPNSPQSIDRRGSTTSSERSRIKITTVSIKLEKRSRRSSVSICCPHPH